MSIKIFALGDSRTGTTTIHKFLQFNGFNSIHYFFDESGVSNPTHVDFNNNWEKLKHFIEHSGFEAFSDYPIRSFYKEIFNEYPDAYYILSTRRDVGTWQKSMKSFFSKFDIAIDIDALTVAYNQINEEILAIAEQRGLKLCNICIDDDSEINGLKISEFLGINNTIGLGWENSTASYDNSLWSSRVTLFNTSSDSFLEYVKRITFPSKAMLSEYGWVYLINDSSDFLDYCYGQRSWTETERNAAVSCLTERHAALAAKETIYLKFLVPEKPIVYPEYMPKVFHDHIINRGRPAVELSEACNSFMTYPADILIDAKSYGHLYFRGDLHANWLGAFFLYQSVVEKLNSALQGTNLSRIPPYGLSDFDVSLASYAGDLYVQLSDEMLRNFDGAWGPLKITSVETEKLENIVRYTLSRGKCKARREDVDPDYLVVLKERETFRYVHEDKSLPRAVIFRDFTADYLVELLAQHFSESLFVWHKGQVYSDIIEREKPDVVLHLMAERFAVEYSRFPAFARLLSQ